MTGIEDLRQTLEEHAQLAPDGAGIVAAAEAGAARIRRRRLHVGIGATVVVAIAALVPVAATRGPTGHPPAVSPSPSRPPYRGPLQLTADLAADGPYLKLEYGAWGTTQFILARPANGDASGWGGTIVVYDPGTLDPAPFKRGERVTVQGHDAFFVQDYPRRQRTLVGGEQMIGLPAVGWPDPSGAWVVVLDSRDKASLLKVAEAVRLGPPGAVLQPFHLGHVPAGLTGVYVRARHEGASDAAVGLGAGGEDADDVEDPVNSPLLQKIPLTIRALPHSEYVDSHVIDLGAPTKVAGLDTWYLTADGKGWLVREGAATLVVNTPHCVVMIDAADRNRLPYDELKRIVEGAEFRDCADARTWTAPLP